MAGSSGSGDDIEAGRTNWAESTTVIQGGRPSELDVPFNGLSVFEAGARRDDQRPDGPVTGATGRGWNGADSPAQRQPGAGVLGIGAPNRGPGLVGLGGGHRITSTFLGSPGNLGESGLGGSGVVGFGGPGDAVADSAAAPDVAMDAPSLPGVGIVGQGGQSFFPTPVAGSADPGTGNGAGVVGIAGGRRRPPNADLSQADLAGAANVGVVGFGGDGPKSVAPGAAPVGPLVPGAGVRGVGGVATDPTTLATAGAPGVVGVAGGVTVPPAGAAADTGVAGFSEVGFGVSGASSRQAGVVGTSDGGPGVLGGSTGGVGVVGNSGTAVGGYFSSERLAQVHLEPHRDPLGSPNGTIPGRAGDLIVLRTRRESDLVTLWFCRRSGNETTAAWVQIV